MMDQLIERYPAQLVEAMEIGENATILPYDQKIDLVYVAGLGGSGIGGDFVAELIRDECKIPYLVGKSYSVPAYLNENTLAIVSSYSGNTEETLEALKGIEASGAKVVIVSGGGKLIEIAKEKGYDMIINVKFETTSISKGAKNALGTVEVYVYGSALKTNQTTE